MCAGATQRKGESCRRIHSPLFARMDATTYVRRRDIVRANHAGEFIRRYSPCGAHVSARRLHGACGFCYDTHNNLTLYVKNGST